MSKYNSRSKKIPKKEFKTGKKTKLDEAHKSTNCHFNSADQLFHSADHQLGEESIGLREGTSNLIKR